MKKWAALSVLLTAFSVYTHAQQRVVAECTIIYSINVAEGNKSDSEVVESLKATTKTVYIKANDSRTDLISRTYKQSVIYNKVSGNTVILREFGQNKYLTSFAKDKWTAANKRYENALITLVPGETKTILGYECRKAIMRLKDSTQFVLYYAPAIIPSVKEFEYQFRDIPGFVLEYESQEADRRRIRYTATKINLSPVPASRFDIPTNGYRVLNN